FRPLAARSLCTFSVTTATTLSITADSSAVVSPHFGRYADSPDSCRTPGPPSGAVSTWPPSKSRNTVCTADTDSVPGRNAFSVRLYGPKPSVTATEYQPARSATYATSTAPRGSGEEAGSFPVTVRSELTACVPSGRITLNR